MKFQSPCQFDINPNWSMEILQGDVDKDMSMANHGCSAAVSQKQHPTEHVIPESVFHHDLSGKQYVCQYSFRTNR